MKLREQEFSHGISTIDANFMRSGLAAIHLIVEQGGAAIIDTGASSSVPFVLEALRRKGMSADQVDYVILTHVHLDHAGGAGELMRHCPNAQLVVHPRGARHMIAPSKLIAGATEVYGTQGMLDMYGEILPVPAERVIEAPDGFQLAWRGRPLLFLDTPGHARHHCCIVDETSRSIFSGDTFGISYRDFDVDGREFIFPTTTPVQFDPPALHVSIDRLLSYQPRQIFLTHYSRVTQIERLAQDLHELIDQHVNVAQRFRGEPAQHRHQLIRAGLESLLLERLRAHGCQLPLETQRELLSLDTELNAQGLGVWLSSASAG